MILKALAGVAAVAVLLPFALIASQPLPRVVPEPVAGQGLDFAAVMGGADWPPGETVTMRDGATLPVRRFGTGGPLVILLHGSGWHGRQFARFAPALAKAAEAEVLVPDLRGHGAAPLRRGDIDHIGQLEEDVADLIAAFGSPGRKVVLLGHSSGGGLVVRFAGGAYGGEIDGAVLLAPFLQHDAPTTRPGSGGWAQPLVRRIVGLSMLNAAGIKALNHLPVIRFAFPRAVLDGPLGATATPAYSYRLNVSYAPRRDWRADAGALPRFLLVAGTADQAFRAEAYRPTLEPVTAHGEYVLLDGVGHLELVDAPGTLAAVAGFLDGL